MRSKEEILKEIKDSPKYEIPSKKQEKLLTALIEVLLDMRDKDFYPSGYIHSDDYYTSWEETPESQNYIS